MLHRLKLRTVLVVYRALPIVHITCVLRGFAAIDLASIHLPTRYQDRHSHSGSHVSRLQVVIHLEIH